MELKLNIYNKDRSVEKTYHANDYAVFPPSPAISARPC